jgi:hypothetical protein
MWISVGHPPFLSIDHVGIEVARRYVRQPVG